MPDWKLQRLGGEFVVVWWEGDKRHRVRLGTRDPVAAARNAPGVFARLTKPKGTTCAEIWEGYRRDKLGRAVLATMVQTWKSLGPRFGPMDALAVTVEDCRAHTEARRARGIKDGTIHTELGHLRMVLLWAVKQGLIDKAPHIERPAKPKPKEKHLGRDQIRALLSACEMPHVRLFVLLGFATAGRAAALLGLRWDRVDFERSKIDLSDPSLTAPHKGRAVVPMTRTLRAALLEAKRGARTPYVIEWAGRPVKSVKRGLRVAGERAGLGHVTAHMLRHSAAVRQAEAGVPMEEIASHLGHRNPAITRAVYARFSPEALRRSAEALELDDGPMEVRKWNTK